MNVFALFSDSLFLLGNLCVLHSPCSPQLGLFHSICFIFVCVCVFALSWPRISANRHTRTNVVNYIVFTWFLRTWPYRFALCGCCPFWIPPFNTVAIRTFFCCSLILCLLAYNLDMFILLILFTSNFARAHTLTRTRSCTIYTWWWKNTLSRPVL